MNPSAEPLGLSLMMIVAAIVLIGLAATVGYFVLRARFRPPARQGHGPVEAGTHERQAP
jgi:hypothetical protein